MNENIKDLLRKAKISFALFFGLFVLAHFFVLQGEEEVPEELRVYSDGPETYPVFAKDFREWKVDRRGFYCPSPCLGCKRTRR